jgi:adenosylmethionine-8-amino-7-oxononanoate aminotransferase
MEHSMATASHPHPVHDATTLQRLAKRHLWMHFTRLGGLPEAEVPVIVRGEGCYVWDEHGNRYLDGLSSLFCVNLGHGRADLAQAGADQARELDYFSTWSYAHPPAIELATRVAELAPGDLNRVFFTSGGSESVESALKLSRAYHKATGNPNKTKVVAREIAYHGTSLGALSATGVTALRTPFEPLTPGGVHVPNTNLYRLPEGVSPDTLAEAVRERILFEGPETVGAVIMEPVQNAGGCLTPPDGYFQRIREICDELDVLMISDEVICSWGRLGTWFGSQRYGYLPDIITTAKGITGAIAPLGAMIVSDRVAAPFTEGEATFLHGFTFAGHPLCAAVGLAAIDAYEREGVLEHVRAHEGALRAMLESLRDIPIVGDVRGAGYFYAIELVKDRDTKETFSDDEAETLLRGFLSGELFRRGLICRADDRGDPVIQLSPPLIAGPEQFEEIEAVLRPVLEEATRRMDVGGRAGVGAGAQLKDPGR